MKPLRVALVSTLGTLCLFAAPALTGPSSAADREPPQPGDYCPFPEQGQAPVCLLSAKQRYGDFFEAVDGGELAQIDSKHVARDLAGGGADEDSYLALSSLAYAYYRLAQSVAASPNPEPALVTRLESWNRLFSSAYAESRPQSHFREALWRAAADLHRRAPLVRTACEGSQDGAADCATTSSLLQTLQQLDDPADERGVRGALSRLLARMLGWGGR